MLEKIAEEIHSLEKEAMVGNKEDAIKLVNIFRIYREEIRNLLKNQLSDGTISGFWFSKFRYNIRKQLIDFLDLTEEKIDDEDFGL